MGVRKNLYSFLASMADEGGQQLLWIDALCIDQCNLYERNHQVAIMGEIYSRAEKVIVWLGVGTEKTNEQLMSLSTGFTNPSERARISEWTQDLADCIICLCWALYWTRVWIVQEVVLASELELRCGTQRIDGNELVWLFKTAEFELTQASGDSNIQNGKSNLVAETLLSSPAMHIIRHRIERIQSHAHYRGLSITSLQATFAGLQCKDPRDRVYGMLALANPDDLALINVTPDYTKPVEEVLSEWRLKLFKYRWMLSYPLYRLPPRVEGFFKCGVGEALWKWIRYDRSAS
ncbi:hypothetical protein DM02DRAFT_608709 [Periconia macrospinosa]|uniref:Heterokaryon incompatibility domain-containing protein n=1 Tax=Periconia macrospinosa TaxID=97972 RepID=A0A2V1EC48_9PLEO|nr:hypothetical protein DM02DRAFT_608709 [Periconia macrospinosa]